jgi:hypothetical protein
MGPHPDQAADEVASILDGKLEPELKHSMDERAPLYSIAISLKRIADVLAGTDTHGSILELIADRIPNR